MAEKLGLEPMENHTKDEMGSPQEPQKLEGCMAKFSVHDSQLKLPNVKGWKQLANWICSIL